MCRCCLETYNGDQIIQMTQKTPPIIQAIKRGDRDLATRLIHGNHYGHIDEQGYNNDGAALYWACCRGFLDVAHLLLMHCADVTLTTVWGATTLHAAADNGHAAIARNIIDDTIEYNRAVRQLAMKDLTSSIWFTYIQARPELDSVRRTYIADFPDAVAKTGCKSSLAINQDLLLQTILDVDHCSVNVRQEEDLCIRLLLRMGADQNAQTRLGDTSCHMAAYRDHVAVLQVLAEAGADLSLRNNRDRTALMTAEMRKNTKAMTYLRALSDLDKDGPDQHDFSCASPTPHLQLHDVTSRESETTSSKHRTPCSRRNTSNSFHKTGSGKPSAHKASASGGQTPVKPENIHVPGSSRTEQLKAQVYSKNLETTLLKR